MWLLWDQKTISKYGLGYTKPAPLPLSPLVRKSYLVKAASIAESAARNVRAPATLQATVDRHNASAVHGTDSEFGRDSTAFSRYLADPGHQPKTCVAPIGAGPYYAVKVFMGT